MTTMQLRDGEWKTRKCLPPDSFLPSLHHQESSFRKNLDFKNYQKIQVNNYEIFIGYRKLTAKLPILKAFAMCLAWLQILNTLSDLYS